MHRTIRQFVYDFGASADNLTVVVPAGSPVKWHKENACFYVVPSYLPPYAQHDATYRGAKVAPDNVETSLAPRLT